jgi:predicted amidohydrolase
MATSPEPFLLCERKFSDDEAKPSFGLANIQARVPDVAANKARILEALKIFKKKRVNIAIFPEFCLSGYFWENEEECRPYMERAATDHHANWIEEQVKPLLDDHLQGIIFNGIRRGTSTRMPTTATCGI